MKNENALQTKCLVWLRAFGGEWENRSPGFFGHFGVPDIGGTLYGRSIRIELKNPNENGPKATDTRWPLQLRYLEKNAVAGGISIATNDFNYLVRTLLKTQSAPRTPDLLISLAKPALHIYWEKP